MTQQDQDAHERPQRIPRPDHPMALERVTIGGKVYPVWPDDIRIHSLGQGIIIAENTDVAQYRQSLIADVLAAEDAARLAEPSPYLGAGGQKIRNLPAMNNPFFELIDKRARLMFMLAYNKKGAVVDDCWANIFTDGEWSNPHCHKRAEASIVLSLKPTSPEMVKQDFSTGQFYFADPRIKQCCPIEVGYVSNTWMPLHGHDCLLIMFPGFVTHGVTPHRGADKRISVAWNVNEHKLPGDVTHDGGMKDWVQARDGKKAEG